MQIEILARHFPMTDALHEYITRRLEFALGTKYEHIQLVKVRLSDVNGPRGGKDKCCHIRVVMPKHTEIVIEDTEFDLYVAIDRAADRASRAVARKLNRNRVISRTHSIAGRSVTATFGHPDFI